MGLRARAIADIRRITSDKVTGAGVDLTFTSRKDATTVTIVGLHTRHHLSVSAEGNFTNDLNAHCSFSEGLLVSAGYPVRNAQNLVDMKDDVLHATDSAGIDRKYRISQVHPDETFGLIRCILEDAD